MLRKTHFILVCALVLSAAVARSQAAYVLPSPTGADEEITLFIDIAQSVDGSQNNAIKAMLTDHPEDSVFLWTWSPAAPPAGLGDWDNSSDAMLLTHEGGLLYSITFVPTEFYGVDGPTFFANGISCLAKLRDGNAYDGEYDGEAKTEDLTVNIVPKLCDKVYCVFPEIGQADDYVHITYDNSIETYEGLQDINPDQVYLYMVATTVEDPFTLHVIAPESDVTMTDALKMEQVLDDPEKFRLVFLPEEFFTTIPPGETLKQIQFRVLTPGFSYPGPPPSSAEFFYSFLICE